MQDAYIACYDIACTKRRRQALALLLDHAGSRQWSVFECLLSRAEASELCHRMHLLLEPGDRFLLIRCRPEAAIRLGTIPPDVLHTGYVE